MFKLSIFLAALIIACSCLSFNKHSQNSWDLYLDYGVQLSNGNCDKLAIIALDGGAPQTSPSHPNSLQITAAEGQKIAGMMKDESFTSAQLKGIFLEGVQYNFLRTDGGRVVYAKKIGYGTIVIQKSETAVVIGHTPQGKQWFKTMKAVEQIGIQLENAGM